MAVTLNRMAPDEPPTLCQGCGVTPSACRVETCPEVDDVDPADLFLCDSCLGELKRQVCPGTVTPGARGGKVSKSHPDQSKRAAATVESGTQQAALLDIVDRWTDGDPRGATCAEAAPNLSNRVGHVVSRNQTATRMGELAEKGLVQWLVDGSNQPQPIKRTTEGDNEGQVWIVTVAGHREAARLAQCST